MVMAWQDSFNNSICRGVVDWRLEAVGAVGGAVGGMVEVVGGVISVASVAESVVDRVIVDVGGDFVDIVSVVKAFGNVTKVTRRVVGAVCVVW